MAVPVIPKGSDHFFNILYEGNGGGQRVGKFIPFTDNGTIAKSCIFSDDDSSYLNRTSGTATSTRIFTVSVWAKRATIGTHTILNLAPLSGSTAAPTINWGASGTIQLATSGGSVMNKVTTRTYENTSKWFHIVARFDTTQSTAADRVRLYVDGDQVTEFGTNTIPSQNTDFVLNSQVMQIGRATSSGSPTQYLDGYLAELHYADGQSYGPDTFGLTDTSTGRWIPKSLGSITYGNNGFRLEFANSAGQTIGDDTSGNGNDFTVNNMAATDITTDSPTQNHATFDPGFSSSTMGLTQGNLTVTDNGGTAWETAFVGIPVQSGKWYFEATVDVAGLYDTFFGVNPLDTIATNKIHFSGYSDGSVGFQPYSSGDYVYHGNSGNNYYQPGESTSMTNGDKIGIAYDADTGAFWAAKNNTWISSGDPANGTNPLFSGYTAGKLVYFGLSNTVNGTKHSVNFGQRGFSYTPPTGFKALQQDNLPEAKNDFADFVWIKNRDQADSHQLYDTNRGRHKDLHSDNTQTEGDITDGVQKFLNGGFEIEDNTQVNTSGESYVSWTWHLNSGTTAANTDGSGATLTSTVQANQDAGVSIVTYAGSSSGSKTVAHGLTEIPEMIWIKNMTDTRNWFVYHKNASYASMVPYDGNAAYYMLLNSSNARDSGNVFNNTAPTNKIFHIQDAGSLNTNGSGKNYIAYVFHSVAGFSKIGLYKGNGSSQGPYVYTGFKPSFLLVKCLSPSGRNWILWDNKRSPINPCDNVLYPDLSQAETTSGNDMDFLSNGFKPRGTNGNYNTSSRNYTYMAFAEHPFIGDGTNPVTAR